MHCLHRYADYRWLRGFNVIASWGARIEQAWWDYDGARFREEIAPALTVHANCIRLWIEFTAWMADPDRVQAAFMDAVVAVREAGMTTMPCLFNRWHDFTYDYGGTYVEDLHRDIRLKLEYVRALVAPLARDPSILVWDLCNEPQAAGPDDPLAGPEVKFLTAVAEAVRACGIEQPVTVGTHQLARNMELYGPLCDVLCCHPYGHTEQQLAGMLVHCAGLQRQFAKPMLSNETVPGCLDDHRRGACARWTVRMMEDAGYGWMGWGMREGKAISTRRDRYDGNGLDGQGFHAWFRRDGSLRPGLEFLLDPPRFAPPWQTA